MNHPLESLPDEGRLRTAATDTTGADASHEWRAVSLLCLGFGLVGIDRFMIMPLFPVMARDLGLGYQDLGHITGALAIAWGIAAMFMGRLSDRLGTRRVVVPSIILFSLLAGFSGLATGVASLIAIRALMGLAEGAYTPASIVATLQVSHPSRQGRNIGIQQAALPLFGLGIAPVLVTQLLQVVAWHWIFALVSLPGLLVAWLLHRNLRPTDADAGIEAGPIRRADGTPDISRWHAVLRHRNVLLGMIGMLCWLTNLVVLSAMLPSYLTDHLKLSVEQMGWVLSAIGFGGTLGTLIMPALSDRYGRKPVMIASVLGAALGLALFMHTGADPQRLFAGLFITLFFVFSLICLTVGPLSAESVPSHLMSTASGLVVGVGEIFGGGIAPVIAGAVAEHLGIDRIMHLAAWALAVGLVVALSVRETAPGRRLS